MRRSLEILGITGIEDKLQVGSAAKLSMTSSDVRCAAPARLVWKMPL